MVARAGAPLVQTRNQTIDRLEVPPSRPLPDHEVVFDAERGKDLAFLRHPTESGRRTPMRGGPRDVAAAPNDGAAAHAGEAHDGEEERRLAFFFQAEDGIRDIGVTGVQTCALPI